MDSIQSNRKLDKSLHEEKNKTILQPQICLSLFIYSRGMVIQIWSVFHDPCWLLSASAYWYLKEYASQPWNKNILRLFSGLLCSLYHLLLWTTAMNQLNKTGKLADFPISYRRLGAKNRSLGWFHFVMSASMKRLKSTCRLGGIIFLAKGWTEDADV